MFKPHGHAITHRPLSREGIDIAMEPVIIPIDGVLDLHTFSPGELKDLLNDYIDACLEESIHELRIIHGKGSGVMRKRVHALLKKNPRVQAFRDAPPEAGGWGATLVTLGRRIHGRQGDHSGGG